MLLFVDDFTRYTYVYFVKEKLEALCKFLEFTEIVKGVLNSKINKLRTNMWSLNLMILFFKEK